MKLKLFLSILLLMYLTILIPSTYAINYPPVADANGPYTADAGSTVTLDGSGSFDPDGDIVVYEWDLDNDGQYDDAVGVTVSHSWGLGGVYTVGLRVTDENGATSTDTATVIVNPGFVIPEFSFGTITFILTSLTALALYRKRALILK